VHAHDKGVYLGAIVHVFAAKWKNMIRSGLRPPDANVYTGLPSKVWLLSAKCLVPDAPLNPMSHGPSKQLDFISSPQALSQAEEEQLLPSTHLPGIWSGVAWSW
jgi:hypothetical protein